jgi:hypothetical protein
MSLQVTFNADDGAEVIARKYAAIAAFTGIETSGEVVEAATTPKAAAGKGAAGKPGKTAKVEDDSPNKTLEEIRELAGQFETDEMAEAVVEIMGEMGADSVSWFKDKPNATRVELFDKLTASLKKFKKAAALK